MQRKRGGSRVPHRASESISFLGIVLIDVTRTFLQRCRAQRIRKQ